MIVLFDKCNIWHFQQWWTFDCPWPLYSGVCLVLVVQVIHVTLCCWLHKSQSTCIGNCRHLLRFSSVSFECCKSSLEMQSFSCSCLLKLKSSRLEIWIDNLKPSSGIISNALAPSCHIPICNLCTLFRILRVLAGCPSPCSFATMCSLTWTGMCCGPLRTLLCNIFRWQPSHSLRATALLVVTLASLLHGIIAYRHGFHKGTHASSLVHGTPCYKLKLTMLDSFLVYTNVKQWCHKYGLHKCTNLMSKI